MVVYPHYLKSPAAIESQSFKIISKQLEDRGWGWWTREQALVIMRIIHTTADFSFAETTEISPGAIEIAVNVIKEGARIITDTNMAKAGISQTALRRLKGKVSCYMDDDYVVSRALEEGVTRAAVSMRVAARTHRHKNNCIFAIGNAPTALFELINLHERGLINPALIIGVPVGFVGAAEAKEAVRSTGIPYIITRGQKGGSNVAAAIVNALLYIAAGREKDSGND